MAYQARRMKKVIEEFELVDENGQTIECLQVELDAGSMLEKLRKKYVNLIRAQQGVQKIELDMGDEKVLEGYNVLGIAVCDLIEAVFGKEDTQKIMRFYENNYVELFKQVIPFITDIVLPKVNEVAKRNRQEILSQYDRKEKLRTKKGLK